jgi:hypothetical protein
MQRGLQHERPSSLAFPSLAEALARGPACFPPAPPPPPSTVHALADDLRARMAKNMPSEQTLKEARALVLRRFVRDLVARRNITTGIDAEASTLTPERAEDLEIRPARPNSSDTLVNTSDSESLQSSSDTEGASLGSDGRDDFAQDISSKKDLIAPYLSCSKHRQSTSLLHPYDRAANAFTTAVSRCAGDQSWTNDEVFSLTVPEDGDSTENQRQNIFVSREPRQSILRRRSSDRAVNLTATTDVISGEAQSSDDESNARLEGLVYNYETDVSRSASSHRASRQSVASLSHRVSDIGGWEVRPCPDAEFGSSNVSNVATTESTEIHTQDEEDHTREDPRKHDRSSVDRQLDFTEMVRHPSRESIATDLKNRGIEFRDPPSPPDYCPEDNGADADMETAGGAALDESNPTDPPREQDQSPQLLHISHCDVTGIPRRRSIPAGQSARSGGAATDKQLEFFASDRDPQTSLKKRRPLAVIDCNQVANLRVNIEPAGLGSSTKLDKKPPARRKMAATTTARTQSRPGGHPRQWRELKHLDVARARKAMERGREGAAVVGESSDDRQENTRRSKRQRFPVLKFWKGETIVYERRKSQIMPTIAEIVLDGSDSEESMESSLRARPEEPQRKRSRNETVS